MIRSWVPQSSRRCTSIRTTSAAAVVASARNRMMQAAADRIRVMSTQSNDVAGDQTPPVRGQEGDDSSDLAGLGDMNQVLLAGDVTANVLCHPPGVGHRRVDDVGGDSETGELRRR